VKNIANIANITKPHEAGSAAACSRIGALAVATPPVKARSLARTLEVVLALCCLAGREAVAQEAACFSCTQVIGYSQVGAFNGWFVKDGVFESIVGSDGWQLIWENGATLHDWQRPLYRGWTNPIVSPCATNSLAPDRVLLNLAGTNETDVAAWVNDINATIDTIMLKLPSVRRIILQSIVGGPANQVCVTTNGDPVRASVSHPYMDEAIALVVAARAGTQPEVGGGHFARGAHLRRLPGRHGPFHRRGRSRRGASLSLERATAVATSTITSARCARSVSITSRTFAPSCPTHSTAATRR
jgi:hypothetical protein